MNLKFAIILHILVSTVISLAAAQSWTCYGVMTSEGPRTLQHGQKACAPLRDGEGDSELGKQFLTCSEGAVHTQVCQPQLRYDTATDSCNWPALATCALPPDTVTERPNVPTVAPAINTTRTGVQPTTLPGSAYSTTQKPTQTTRATPTGPCNTTSCKLPDCFCLGASPPSIPLADLPMFIMMTFDDALTNSLYDSFFRALVVDNEYKLFNPNGCRSKSTFFISHENTDYTKVTAIWNAGNEIGSHTIHHRLPQGDSNSDYPEMVKEIQGLKDEMLKATGNKALVDSASGFRAPYLRAAGDVQYDVLRDYGFLYDTSILNINLLQGKKPDWPFTLDFVIADCINPPCPTKGYPGLWEIPLNGWIGDDKQGCSMMDSCVVGRSPWSATEQEWYNYYNRNFLDYFYVAKVPMPIFTHGSMFTNYPNSFRALTSWLQDQLLTRKNVWLVTPTQVIDWMKSPLSNSDMITKKWGC